ncbi:tRNA-dependent lipid II-Ala--L-alanine ligase [Streptococcus sp. DD10]|uniref:aminoacyltransferase n=1 Tax=Streptococcus sp. DD10 TaxID=1777878 RepID=UPI000799C327|nr:aminoacyltransferase [Streptococcus sp. DD10]KXT77208.1 tRNA-dependent lipid II-Ala--L-alanine ligase [Streptococcus sp. DD10]
MTLTILSKEEFRQHAQKVHHRSFLQTTQMADLLEKRGYTPYYIGWKEEEEILVSSLLYTIPMTGGLRMEINSGPVYTDPSKLTDFYKALQDFAKKKGVLELLIKPYNTYQSFDSEGKPTSSEDKILLNQLTSIGYHHDGLTTGYPGGEGDWHYVKDMEGINENTLIQSFSKKGKPLVKKAKTFGIQLKKLQRNELHLFKEITSSTSDRRDYSDKSLEYYEYFFDAFGDTAEFMVATLNFQDYYQNLEKDQSKLKQKMDRLQADLEKNPNSEKKHNQLREISSQYDTFQVRKAEAQDFIQKYGQEDVVLAGSLFVYTPQETTYLFSGSYTEFNKFYAPAILQEYVMLETIKRGIPRYNFLGIMGIFDGSDGVLRFKQNFNGYIVRKMGTFRYYPHPLKYKVIASIKRLLGRS